MDFELVLMTALAGLAGVIGLRFMWISHRIPMPRTIKHTAIDPIAGAKDRVAVFDPDGSFIPMPNHLKTNDEMVAWMTEELPKLAAGKARPRR
jgi:hypothetical protein